MLSKINPAQTQAWSKLVEHYADVKSTRMKTLFANDPDRFGKMSIQFNEIIFDYSKNIITDEPKKYLLGLVEECDLKPAIEAKLGFATGLIFGPLRLMIVLRTTKAEF